MSDRAAAQRTLTSLDPAAWPGFLEARSGLPGRRADVTLVQAAATVAGPAEVAALLAAGTEYAAMCAAAALARRGGTEGESRARSLAADERWRVREGVVLGLQLRGDEDPEGLVELVQRWVDDGDLLVQRAAVAAICEPRLLRTPVAAAAALAACRRATEHVAGLPADLRARPATRVLRQALGYCWSVAVAAAPAAGLAMLLALDTDDPDVAWIVRENRRKKRLARLLEDRTGVGEEGLEPPTFRV
ncbi:hypothetical protein GCM10027215_38750 [Nocardioides zeae]